MRILILFFFMLSLTGCILESNQPLLPKTSWSPFENDIGIAQTDAKGKLSLDKGGKAITGFVNIGWRSHSIKTFPLEIERELRFHQLAGTSRFIIEQQEGQSTKRYASYLGEIKDGLLLVWSYKPAGNLKKEINSALPNIKPAGNNFRAISTNDVLGAWTRISIAIDQGNYEKPKAYFRLASKGQKMDDMIAQSLSLQCLGLAGHGALPEQAATPKPFNEGIALSAIQPNGAIKMCGLALDHRDQTPTRIALARALVKDGQEKEALRVLNSIPKADAGKAFMIRAYMLATGQGLTKDHNQLRKEGQALIDKGDPYAAYTLSYYQAFTLRDSSQYLDAHKNAKFAVDNGIPQANVVLGYLWRQGLGVSKNPERAFSYFKRAADVGEVNGRVYTADAYYFGHGIKQNYTKAFQYSKLAADAGDAYSQYFIGFMYKNAQGTKKNNGTAVRYFKKSHAQGNVDATAELGWMTYNGLGTKADTKKGKTYLDEAAEKGNKTALKYLKTLKNPSAQITSKAPNQFAADIERLFKGERIRFSKVNTPFMAGLASVLLERCSNIPSKTRVRVAGFVATSTTGAILGSDYSNSNIGKALGNAAKSQATLAAGSKFAQSLQCGTSTNKLLFGIEKSAATLDQGPFLDSCKPTHGSTKCACLAKTARQVFPDIMQRYYSGALIKDLIARNPFIGLQVGLTCGISRY